MPWPSGKQFAAKHNHSLKGPAAQKAADIASAVLRKSGDEGKAIRIANAKVGQMRKRGRISDKAHAKHSVGLDRSPDLDASTR